MVSMDPPHKKQKNLGLPAPYTYKKIKSTYRAEWERRRRSITPHVEILDLLWIADDAMLVACTSVGSVFAWRCSKEADEELRVAPERICKLDVSSRGLTAIQLSQIGESRKTLFIAGQEGFWSISIPDLLEGKDATKWKSVSFGVNHFGVFEDRIYMIQNAKAHIFDATNQREICHHQLNYPVTAMSLAKGKEGPLVLLGTTKSLLLVWNPMAKDGDEWETLTLHAVREEKKKGLPFEISVTSICVTQDQWWTIGGSRTKSNGKGPLGGAIATWHGPTRSMVSSVETRETVHRQVCVSDSTSASLLYSAANEGVVSVWKSPFSLELTRRLWVSQPSGKALVAIHDGENMFVAVAGVGPKIDILQDFCRIQTLEFDQSELQE